MSRLLMIVAVMVLTALTAGHAAAQRWRDATASCIGTTAQWTNEVDLADLDGDGQVDLLVANGSGYANAGASEATRIWRNTGGWGAAGSHCSEISAEAVLGLVGNSRTIKAADVDGDGDLDILTGGGFGTQLKLFARDQATMTWTDATARLPQQLTSIGDVEVGDVDGDGDMDLLLAEWGAIDPGDNGYQGGRTRLYINDGSGAFTDATTTRMPDLLVGWSWDVELVDVDQDWDLDALVSSKLSTTSFLFRNDGAGVFTNDPDALPHFTNNYEFEPMDIDGDGDLDLATINDGGMRRDRIFVNDGTGKYADETATRLAGTTNPTTDDNAVVFLDADADGDADMLVASLSGPDRLNLNNGTGTFTLASQATPNDTPGSLAIAVADLDGDGRLDILQGQGESAFADKVQLASDMIAIDTVAPVVTRVEVVGNRVLARVHDHQSPSRAHDWQRVWLEHGGGEVDMRWYGEYLWRADAAPVGAYRVCAKDRRGNQGCSAEPVTGDTSVSPEAGVDPPPGTSPGGCCDTGGSPTGALGGILIGLFVLRRRR